MRSLILNDINTALASNYGFTTEALYFILNYDIMYRLGRSMKAEDE